MSRTAAQLMATIRDTVISQLVDGRETLEQVYLGMDGDELRQSFRALLSKLEAFVTLNDREVYVSYVRRWVALRVGAGARLPDLIPALVGVGDAVIHAAQRAGGDTDEIRAFVRDVAAANLAGAQVVVGVLADELNRRRTQVERWKTEVPTHG